MGRGEVKLQGSCSRRFGLSSGELWNWDGTAELSYLEGGLTFLTFYEQSLDFPWGKGETCWCSWLWETPRERLTQEAGVRSVSVLQGKSGCAPQHRLHFPYRGQGLCWTPHQSPFSFSYSTVSTSLGDKGDTKKFSLLYYSLDGNQIYMPQNI